MWFIMMLLFSMTFFMLPFIAIAFLKIDFSLRKKYLYAVFI
jgi:hypothetical protein